MGMTEETRSENIDRLRAEQAARSALPAEAQRQSRSAKDADFFELPRPVLSASAYGSMDAKRACPCRRTAAAFEGNRRARPASSGRPATCRPSQAQATRSAAVPAHRVGENDSPQSQHTPPQPQGSPLRERLPSTTRTGIATRAATGSAQRKCHNAFRASPKSVIAARYAQVADCTASAARARLLMEWAVLLLPQARRGITIKAAIVMPIPAQLVSGRTLASRVPSEIRRTTPARMNSRMPAIRAACGGVSLIQRVNCKRTTRAERNSTRLSAPKARRAGLCADSADISATPHSTIIQHSVTVCSQ